MSHNLSNIIIAQLTSRQLHKLISSPYKAEVAATKIKDFYFIHGAGEFDDYVKQIMADHDVSKYIIIDTDYFAGSGSQSYELFVHKEYEGKKLFYCQTQGERINDGLKLIEPSEGYFMDPANTIVPSSYEPTDMFDAIGLCRYRNSYEIFSGYGVCLSDMSCWSCAPDLAVIKANRYSHKMHGVAIVPLDIFEVDRIKRDAPTIKIAPTRIKGLYFINLSVSKTESFNIRDQLVASKVKKCVYLYTDFLDGKEDQIATIMSPSENFEEAYLMLTPPAPIESCLEIFRESIGDLMEQNNWTVRLKEGMPFPTDALEAIGLFDHLNNEALFFSATPSKPASAEGSQSFGRVRRAFEGAYQKQCQTKAAVNAEELFKTDEQGHYVDQHVAGAWWAWQSRA